jgi:hypothetical protein
MLLPATACAAESWMRLLGIISEPATWLPCFDLQLSIHCLAEAASEACKSWAGFIVSPAGKLVVDTASAVYSLRISSCQKQPDTGYMRTLAAACAASS